MRQNGNHACPLLRGRRGLVLLGGVLLFSGGGAGGLVADDPPAVTVLSPATEEPDPTITVPVDSPPPEKLTEDSEDLTDSRNVEDADPEVLLNAALDAMDQAAAELDQEATTEKAITVQQAAVDRLKELLAATSSSNSNAAQSPQNPDSPADPQSGTPEDQSMDSHSSDPSGNGGRRADDQNSAESSEQVNSPTQAGGAMLGSGAKANSVWGHLPPREREALFRSLSDQFLPEYEAQIRRYYEALAEKK